MRHAILLLFVIASAAPAFGASQPPPPPAPVAIVDTFGGLFGRVVKVFTYLKGGRAFWP